MSLFWTMRGRSGLAATQGGVARTSRVGPPKLRLITFASEPEPWTAQVNSVTPSACHVDCRRSRQFASNCIARHLAIHFAQWPVRGGTVRHHHVCSRKSTPSKVSTASSAAAPALSPSTRRGISQADHVPRATGRTTVYLETSRGVRVVNGRALTDERAITYPNLASVINTFNSSAAVFTNSAFEEASNRTADKVSSSSSGAPEWFGSAVEILYSPGERSFSKNYGALIRILFRIGFIGGQTNSNSSAIYSYDESNYCKRDERLDGMFRFHIHSAFHRALDLSSA